MCFHSLICLLIQSFQGCRCDIWIARRVIRKPTWQFTYFLFQAQLNAARKEWDSQHLKELKERMEWEEEEHELLLTYTREDAYNMVISGTYFFIKEYILIKVPKIF